MERTYDSWEVKGSGGQEDEPFEKFVIRHTRTVQSRRRSTEPWLDDYTKAKPVVTDLPPMTRSQLTRFLTAAVEELAYLGEPTRAPVTPHPEHTVTGPADCSRCQLLRDNQHWMAGS